MAAIKVQKLSHPSPSLKWPAWVIMFLASSITPILWRELAGGEPYWWSWVLCLGLLTILSLTLIRADLKPLKGYALILLTTFLLGYGNPPQTWGLITIIRSSTLWINWAKQAPWAISNIALHLLRLTPTMAAMTILILMGRKRKEFYLALGKLNSSVEPSKLLGMKKPESWTRIGSIFAAVFTVATLMFLIATWKVPSNAFLNVVPLIPAAFFIASINAFNEEFTLRAAPLSTLTPAVGEKQSNLITAVNFGLGHFYGVPNGLPGVLMSTFLGWFLGKSLLETKGFFWAWLIHFFPDVIIFTFYAMIAV